MTEIQRHLDNIPDGSLNLDSVALDQKQVEITNEISFVEREWKVVKLRSLNLREKRKKIRQESLDELTAYLILSNDPRIRRSKKNGTLRREDRIASRAKEIAREDLNALLKKPTNILKLPDGLSDTVAEFADLEVKTKKDSRELSKKFFKMKELWKWGNYLDNQESLDRNLNILKHSGNSEELKKIHEILPSVFSEKQKNPIYKKEQFFKDLENFSTQRQKANNAEVLEVVDQKVLEEISTQIASQTKNFNNYKKLVVSTIVGALAVVAVLPKEVVTKNIPDLFSNLFNTQVVSAAEHKQEEPGIVVKVNPTPFSTPSGFNPNFRKVEMSATPTPTQQVILGRLIPTGEQVILSPTSTVIKVDVSPTITPEASPTKIPQAEVREESSEIEDFPPSEVPIVLPDWVRDGQSAPSVTSTPEAQTNFVPLKKVDSSSLIPTPKSSVVITKAPQILKPINPKPIDSAEVVSSPVPTKVIEQKPQASPTVIESPTAIASPTEKIEPTKKPSPIKEATKPALLRRVETPTKVPTTSPTVVPTEVVKRITPTEVVSNFPDTPTPVATPEEPKEEEKKDVVEQPNAEIRPNPRFNGPTYSVEQIDEFISWAASHMNISYVFAKKITNCESTDDPFAINVKSGARGLWQIMPIHEYRFRARGWNYWTDWTDAYKNTVIAIEIHRDQGIGAWECS